MLKKLFIVLFLLSVVHTVKSQDIIHFRDSSSIKVNVVEITHSAVRYTKFKSSSDQIYSINKNSIHSINFADGSHETFELLVVKRTDKDPNTEQIAVKQDIVDQSESKIGKNKDGGIIIKLGRAFPLGKFSSTPNNSEGTYGLFGGDATYKEFGESDIGYSLGFKSLIPITKFGLNLFISLDVIYNRLKRSSRNQLQNDFEHEIQDVWSSLQKYSTKECKSSYMVNNLYFNIPIMVGLNYTYKLNNKIRFFGDAGAGCNFFKSTWMEGYSEFILDGEKHILQETYEWQKVTPSFCYQVGIGAIFFNKLTFDIHYYGISSCKTDYRYERITPEKKFDPVEGTTLLKNAGFITLSVGVFF